MRCVCDSELWSLFLIKLLITQHFYFSIFFFHNSGQKSNTTKHLPKFSQVHRIVAFSSQYCVLHVSFVHSWFVHKLKVFAVHVVPLVCESSHSTVTLPLQACSAGTDWITTYIPAVELNCTGQIVLQINKWSCSVHWQESNYFLMFCFFVFFHKVVVTDVVVVNHKRHRFDKDDSGGGRHVPMHLHSQHLSHQCVWILPVKTWTQMPIKGPLLRNHWSQWASNLPGGHLVYRSFLQGQHREVQSMGTSRSCEIDPTLNDIAPYHNMPEIKSKSTLVYTLVGIAP